MLVDDKLAEAEELIRELRHELWKLSERCRLDELDRLLSIAPAPDQGSVRNATELEIDMTVAQGTPVTHELKCWPKYYRFVKSGAKPFEIRKNDRGFQVGDVLWLREYDPLMDQYSGDECHRTITYTTDYEQRPSYVVLGLGAEVMEIQAKLKFLTENCDCKEIV